MTPETCILIGAPVDSGKRRKGCLMGPDAYRTAGLAEAIGDLGVTVIDRGNVVPGTGPRIDDGHLHQPGETSAWTAALQSVARDAASRGTPVFLGGDHSLSLGSVTGMADAMAAEGKPLFVLWLDAHSDFHTPKTTQSGNLHGTPVAYLTGQPGFDGFPTVANPVPGEQVCMMGIRSVDAAERAALGDTGITVHDMRAIDEQGIVRPLTAFLDTVAQAGGALHVSLDVDFLDPFVAPAVGTTVPGGATVREAHLVMEILHESGLVRSLDLVELNPFLDDRGQTARLMVDLAASVMGRTVFDRPTQPAATARMEAH